MTYALYLYNITCISLVYLVFLTITCANVVLADALLECLKAPDVYAMLFIL